MVCGMECGKKELRSMARQLLAKTRPRRLLRLGISQSQSIVILIEMSHDTLNNEENQAVVGPALGINVTNCSPFLLQDREQKKGRDE